MKELNKKLGLTGKNALTEAKIKAYIKKFNPSEFVCSILNNVTETFEQLAKITGRNITSIRQFYIPAIESVIVGKPKIGSPLELPTLINALKQQRIERTKSKVNDYTIKGKKVYSAHEKDIMRDNIIRLMLAEQSPKTGIVLTLPFKFAMETKILNEKPLSGLTFHGCEKSYSVNKSVESKKIFKEQQIILKNNLKLKRSVLVRNENINDVVQVGSADQYSHVILDYCGNYETNKAAINYVLQNKIVKKGGIIEVTLSVRGSKDIKTKLSGLIKKYSANYVAEELTRLKDVQTLNNVKGLYYYMTSDTNKGGTMYVVVFRRIK